MTEAEARQWLADRFAAERIEKLDRYVQILRREAEQQSLIARSTWNTIWSRHIVDSAQLLQYDQPGLWIDLGSGAGLPGVVAAILRDDDVTVCDDRRKRVEFLAHCQKELAIGNLSVVHARAQSLQAKASIVSARAVAAPIAIFEWSRAIVSRETRFLLPRGRSIADELAVVRQGWNGVFHVEQSVTEPESALLIASDVRRK